MRNRWPLVVPPPVRNMLDVMLVVWKIKMNDLEEVVWTKVNDTYEIGVKFEPEGTRLTMVVIL